MGITRASKKKETKSANMETTVKEYCLHCNTDVTGDGIEALGCEICDQWSCRDCIKVPPDVYRYLEQNTEAFPFICKVCTPKLPEFKEMVEVKQKIASIDKKQQEDNNRITALELQVAELLKAKSKNTEDVQQINLTISEMKASTLSQEDFPELLAANPPQKLVEMISKQVQPSLKPMINTEISERDQIDAIKHNLMISGIAESVNDEEDSTRFTQMIKDEMDLIVEVESVERIQRKTETDEPKLLRVVFKDMKMRKGILSKATTLRNSANEHVKKKVYIRPELTKKQLEESKNLSTQLRAKRAEAENQGRTFKIYRGKIIETTLPTPEIETQE